MKSYFACLSAVLITLLLIPMAALAEAPVYTIDIQPAIDPVINAVFAVIGGLVTFLFNLVWGKNKAMLDRLKIDDSIRAYLLTAIQAGISYAENQLREKLKDIQNPSVKNQFIAIAASYVVSRVPDALRHFDIDDASLAKMIAARMAIKEGGSDGTAVSAQ